MILLNVVCCTATMTCIWIERAQHRQTEFQLSLQLTLTDWQISCNKVVTFGALAASLMSVFITNLRPVAVSQKCSLYLLVLKFSKPSFLESLVKAILVVFLHTVITPWVSPLQIQKIFVIMEMNMINTWFMVGMFFMITTDYRYLDSTRCGHN